MSLIKKLFRKDNKPQSDTTNHIEVNDIMKMDTETRIKGVDLINCPKKENLLSTTNMGKKSIAIADGIMENRIFLMNSLDIIEFTDKIDWNYEHPVSANTYKLYIQCLNILGHLSDAYLETNNIKYLNKAYELLLDWIKFIRTDTTKNKYKWVDHSVANRVINIIYFYTVSKEAVDVDTDLIVDLLIEHGEFLENDKHYRPNNHGIMVDRALIYLSMFLKGYENSERWFQKAKLRIINAVYRDFSNKGVHLENSPSYHTMTRRMFNELERFLKSSGMTLGKEVRQKLIQSNEYIKYIMKPNNELPIIGDTQVSKVRWIEKSYNSFHDEAAGISILQNQAKVPDQSTWCSFICGYSRDTHKHRDDLSFSLYHNGEDIFLDSGRYNYDNHDKYRQYFLSPKSHSTISIVNGDYQIEDPYKYRDVIKTTDFLSNDNYDYVKGINKAYNGSYLTRTLVYFKPNILVLRDFIESDEEKEVEQIFNLAPSINIDDFTTKTSFLTSDRNQVAIEQILTTDSIERYSGELDTPRAIISEEFGKIKENTQLVYKKKGKEVEFLTIISLDYNEKVFNKNINYDPNNQLLTIEVSGVEYKLVL